MAPDGFSTRSPKMSRISSNNSVTKFLYIKISKVSSKGNNILVAYFLKIFGSDNSLFSLGKGGLQCGMTILGSLSFRNIGR